MSGFDVHRGREICRNCIAEGYGVAPPSHIQAAKMLPAALDKINEIGASLIVGNGIISDQAEHIHELSAILEETRSMQVDHNRALEEQHEKDLRVQAKRIQELEMSLQVAEKDKQWQSGKMAELAKRIQELEAYVPDHPDWTKDRLLVEGNELAEKWYWAYSKAQSSSNIRMQQAAADPIRLQDCREEVKMFAMAMETKLRQNDHKGGWKESSLFYLEKRLVEEGRELAHALKYYSWDTNPLNSFRDPEKAKSRVLEETVDMANFLMMIADHIGLLSLEGEP